MNAARTSLFLMANLGAEVSRIIGAQERGDKDSANAALLRAEKILNEIARLPDMQTRAQELEALAKAVHSITADNSSRAVSPAHLKSYFIPFAERLLATRE
ncbi:MAG: hypothetical protein HZA37_02745 [Parcubacteria group bacterium]|nr:hypothetical protein [Parcubacteria group bacterium]